jgi:moderate conductance mechanosensitive channel
MLRPPSDRGARSNAVRLFPFVWFLVALAGLLPAQAMPASAQIVPPQAAETPAVDSQQIDEMIKTLQDPAARDKLIQQLQALRAAQAQAEGSEPESLGATLLTVLSEKIREGSVAFADSVRALLDAPQLADWLWLQVNNPFVRERTMQALLAIAVVLAAAMAAEWLAMRLLARPRRAIEERTRNGIWLQIPLAIVRLLLELLPIAVFATVASIVLPLTDPTQTTRLVTLAIVNANVLVRFVIALARMLLTAKVAGSRLLPLREETGAYLVVWVRRLTVVTVYGYFSIEAARLLGLPWSGHQVLMRLLGLLVAAMLVVFVLQNRSAVAAWIAGRHASEHRGGVRQRFADIWHILAIVYIVANYAVWALGIEGGFQYLLHASLLTVAVLFATRLVVYGVDRIIGWAFAVSAELKANYPGLEPRANRYLPLFQHAIHAAIYLIAFLLVLEAWGVNSFAWFETDLGAGLVKAVVTIALILLIALVLSEVVNAIVEHYLRNGRSDETKRAARRRTLLPLLRNGFRVFLFVIVTLIVLSEIGINIAPLLAGAGVFGLALGFGAQTLVKDVITGIFILAEDTMAVGDVVDLGGPSGVVEAMTIRSIQLRDGAGTVHTVPFSAVTTVKNLTKDFAYAVFNVAIGYEEDVDRVIAILKEIGAGLQEDTTFGWRILEPIEVQGVDQLGETGVTILARIKTRAMRQWDVAREFNRRLNQRFNEEGIERPQRTVYYRTIAPADTAPPTGLPPPAATPTVKSE